MSRMLRQTRIESRFEASDDPLDDPRIAQAMQEYLAAVESGRPISRSAFLSRHADLGPELSNCLAGLEMVWRAAGERAIPVPSDPVDVLGADFGEELGDGASDLPQPKFGVMPSLAQPEPLGDFRILREIGRGGMGVVYEAVQLSLGRRVAVKILPLAASLDPKYLQRFKTEAQAAAQLHHTNIVPVYAVGVERGLHYYAMQLIDGYPISTLIEQLRAARGKTRRSGIQSAESPRAAAGMNASPTADTHDLRGQQAARPTVLTVKHSDPRGYFCTVANLVRQAGRALDYAHQCGVVHRDVKPANLLLDERGELWVADFGLAHMSAETQLTRTGDMIGTLCYMSPEQVSGARVVLDHRTDIYSLGVTLYEMLTLEPFFAGENRQVVLRQILEHDPISPRLIDPQIPRELETILLKATAKSAGERYQTAQQMADDLQRWLDDRPILARRPTWRERAARWRRRHRPLVASATVFLVIAFLVSLASALLILREHSKTKIGYQREIQARQSAEESFRQARRAVDSFTRLSEDELANSPRNYQLRRKFLEASLEYYKDFLDQGHNDPSLRAELSASTRRVARIVEELDVLAGYAPLMLLNDPHVQQELQIADGQRFQLERQLRLMTQEWEQARVGGALSPQQSQAKLADRLRPRQQAIAALLTPAQMQRTLQIARQQQGPFVFKNPEVIAALEFTAMQRKQIYDIIEEERPGKPPRRAARDEPRRDDQPAEESPLRERWLDDQPYSLLSDELTLWPSAESEPSGAVSSPATGPQPAATSRTRRNPPNAKDKANTMRRTVARIEQILSEPQRQRWESLIGPRVMYDLAWHPD